MEEYKNLSSHAQDLEGGRVLAPGETVNLSAEAQKEPHNLALIESGILAKMSDLGGEEENKRGGSRSNRGEEE